MSAVVTVQNLSKAFGIHEVLRDVSLAVDEQDRVAIVGVNGSGKSTLLRIIARALDADDTSELDVADAGVITKRQGASFVYVAQEPRLTSNLSVMATLLTSGAERHACEAMADSLHLRDVNQAVGTLSLGERRRVALGCALLRAPDILALDEPTNHLDARTIDWLEGRLKAHRGAILFVSHDRYFLDRVATRIAELDRGRFYAYGPGYADFLEKQAERFANASERERIRRSFVRREIEWIRRGPAARTTKQQARIDRFDSAVKQGGDNALLVQDDRGVKLVLPPGPRLGKTILELDHLGIDDADGSALVRDLTLVMKAGDRIGIVGANGAGKTTLVRGILGEREPQRGKVTVGQNTRFAYLDQGRADLDDEKSVLEEVAEGSEYVQLPNDRIHVRTFLRMFLFDDRFADTPIGKLSGGERNRVQLTKLLRRGGNVLVLDEPTNDLDLMTLAVLEEALVDFAGCALVVSHDRWFLDRIATGILAFEGNGEVGFYEGNYSDYLAKKPASAAVRASGTKAAPEPAQGQTQQSKKAKKLYYKEQRELDGMETAIAAAEAKTAELEAKLSAPDLYTAGGADVTTMVSQLETARADVERLYARWQELESLVAQL